MVFSSHIFLFLFLPGVLAVYYALPARYRNGTLTFASYAFYGWFEPWFVLLMLASTGVDYLAARLISAPGATSRRRRGAVALSVVVNLGLLSVFKYAVFVQENLNWLLEAVGADAFALLRVTLPIGISFYTFQSMSYTVDVYRGAAKPVRRFTEFACFVSLFPQLVAGPIVRYHQIADQLANRSHDLDRFGRGVALFVFGLAKKVLLANPMGALATSAFAAEAPGPLSAWFGALAFGFQIYFDFSGYSDMAVGLGRMLGFELPKNFDAPYRAESITDFWRRWHISLSTFLRDYLYIPLGGNRRGAHRTLINLALVMLLGGLWHGAAWHFLVWGAFHGALLIGERLIGKRSFVWFAPRPIRIAVTFALVCMGWVFFKADSLAAALAFLGSMLGLVPAGPGAGLLAAELLSVNGLVLGGLCLAITQQPFQAWTLAERSTWPRVAALTGLFWLTACGMFSQSFQPFLYFRF